MSFRLILLALFAFASCFPGAAAARGREMPETEQVFVLEASGTLQVGPDGGVKGVRVLTEFDDRIRSSLAQSISRLRFEPVLVKGQAVLAETGFHVVLLGRKQGENLAITIDSISFQTPKGAKPVPADGAMTPIDSRRMSAPQFPRAQERAGRMGLVRLLLRVAPDGTVADVAVVDSLVYDFRVSPSAARVALHDFELATVREARKWTFIVPPDASGRSAKDMTVGTSCIFLFNLREGLDLTKEGQWLPVHKGPKREVAWLPAAESRRFADTALAEGSVSGPSSAFRLQSPVGGTPVF